ncbi:MAG TPA: 4-hydroxythreonine-4-phosphate dehydrogenase PdxA, partial [Burkholderiales bacterium]|nr:4-hydroxythreonine-4-phosphate dehydrogenase PdxA [Burkholderiales bacterium]
MASPLPLIGLMLGDVTGIGPELCAKILASGSENHLARIVVFGDARVVELGMRDAGVRFMYSKYRTIDDVSWPRSDVPVVDLQNVDPAEFQRGVASPESGRLCGETLKLMIDAALAGKIDGICFAPLNKGALNRGGWKFHDEHQMFASLTRHDGFFGEMNVIEQFSTFRVTSHIALREAVKLVTPERIRGAVKLAHASLSAMGRKAPRIGVAALNPHCGENGLFGDEEITIIRPTVDGLR